MGTLTWGQVLEKVKALCFERGNLLIFDNQGMVVASPFSHVSEHFPVEAQGIGGVPSNQGASQALDTTLLNPSHCSDTKLYWPQLSHAKEIIFLLPFSFLSSASHTPPLISFVILSSWYSNHFHVCALSAPSLSCPAPKNVLIQSEGRFTAIDLPLSSTFPSFLLFFLYFQAIIFVHVQLQIKLIIGRFHISLNQKGYF